MAHMLRDVEQPQTSSGDAGDLVAEERIADPFDGENVGAAIVSGGIWRLVAFGASTAFGILALAIISREIGPAGFALFTTAISLITIASTLSDVGLLVLGVREFTALRGEARERSQRALITLRLVLMCVAAVVIMAFALISDYPGTMIAGLGAASIGLLFYSIHVSYLVPIQASFMLNTVAWLEASRQFLIYGAMIAAVLVAGTVGAVLSIYLPAYFVMAVVTGVLARKLISIVPSWDVPAMLGLLRHVGAFAVSASIGTTYAYLAQIVSNSVLSPHQSGMFALAFRVFAVLVGASMTAISGAFPLLVTSSKNDPERLAYASRRIMQTGVLAGLGCAVGLVGGAAFTIKVLGGAEFSDATTAVAVIGFALPASFVLYISNNVLLAAGHHRAVVTISLVGAAVSVALTALLASAFDATGASAGIVLGELLIAFGYVTQILRFNRRALPGLRWLIAALFAGAFSCLSALLPVPSLLQALIGMAVFAVLCVLLRLLPPELMDKLPLVGGQSPDASDE